MPGLLNASSVMMCPHGGTVQAVPSSANVKPAGAPILTAADTFTIVGCPFMIALAPHPCVSIQWVQTAMKSTVSGNATLTEASVGLCIAPDQAPQGTVIISSTQPKVSGQ